MTLSDQVAENVRACFSGMWIQSHEHDDALQELAQMCRDESWQLASWDIERGLHPPSEQDSATDPISALRSLDAMATNDSAALLVLVNFHRFLNSAEVVQAIARRVNAGRADRTFVIVLSPVVQIPTELEKLFVVLEHALPGKAEIEEIARGVATEDGEFPEGEDGQRVLDAACGLTRFEAEGAFSLSLVRHGRLDATTIWELKSQALRKNGLLSLHRGNETFDDLGGLDSLKAFCRRALRPSQGDEPRPLTRGVMLLGVPGTGKSAFCRALGNEIGRPTLTLDVGALMGSLVGQTEERTRLALNTIDAMQPAVLFIDEVEKAFSGVSGSGQNDSGVSSRMFGSFLSWLNDHDSDVFVVCTANDITRLPPEFCRAQRFDALYFLNLPSEAEKAAIWRQYISAYVLGANQPLPADKNWTGSEVRSCCRLAALLEVPLAQAAEYVVPVAVTATESVERLRTWASGRCLDATHGNVFQSEVTRKKTRRRVSREASLN